MGWTLVVAGNPWQRLGGAVAVAGMTALALEALRLLCTAVWRLTGRTRLRLACRTLARRRRRSR